MARSTNNSSKKENARRRNQRKRRISANLAKQTRDIRNSLQNIQRISESQSNHDEGVIQMPARKKLELWALKHNISRNALCDLLTILIPFGLTWLPSDARTLLETPQDIKIVDSANGKFWHCGLEKNVRRIFATLNKNVHLILNFNVDGLPLFNSSKHEFWPILANINSEKIKESYL